MECKYCKKEFKRKNSQKTCGIECKLKSNIKIIGECWVLQTYRENNKYGIIRHEGKMHLAHRLSYQIFKQEIPEGLCVLHNCPGGDNKGCINPDHLWLGTYKENMQDASKKGRMKGCQTWTDEMHEKMKEKKKTWKKVDNRGEKSALSKLKESDIHEIREMLKKGLTHKEIGKIYGVKPSTIGNINTNRRWTHI